MRVLLRQILSRVLLPGATWLLQAFPGIARTLNGWAPSRRLISGAIIHATASGCPPRPHRLSLWTPPGAGGATPDWATRKHPDLVRSAREVEAAAYVAWPSLTDRRFTARHLPPLARDGLPAPEEVAALFMRPKDAPMKESRQNSALLGSFAQWFTDSFLRTAPLDLRANTSNHEIDFCQIYGLDETRTRALRSHKDGRLQSRETGTGEYLPLLLQPEGNVVPAYAGFDYAQPAGGGIVADGFMTNAGLDHVEIAARRKHLYATGLERGSSNIGYAACSTLFLREHNRIAGLIRNRHPAWTDDRVFETARNAVIVIGLKIVIEEYIVQLAGTPFRLLLEPKLAARKTWYRTNRIAIEFNLLYRWHSMVPDAVEVGGQAIPFHDQQFNNALLEATGVEALVDALSRQPAGYIGLRNVPDFLMPAEVAAHRMSRQFALAPMNAYRARFNLPRIASFAALTDDPVIRGGLETLYRGDIDAVEFLPGLFAEEERSDASFGSLLLKMVGYDAFTQALTNPLLAPEVYSPETFSEVGWEAIAETRSLDDVFRRNTTATPGQAASLALLR